MFDHRKTLASLYEFLKSVKGPNPEGPLKLYLKSGKEIIVEVRVKDEVDDGAEILYLRKKKQAGTA